MKPLHTTVAAFAFVSFAHSALAQNDHGPTYATPDEAATTAINWSISRRVSNRPMGRSSWSIEVSPSVMQAILPEVARLEIGE